MQDARPMVASQTLDAVAREIATTLGEARVAIEGFVEQPDNPAHHHLRKAAHHQRR